MDELISRQAAIEAIAEALKGVFVEYQDIAKKIIAKVPSAQPDLDEFCFTCKEYDQERHCCPRFNRVIRNALKDAQPEQRWIPMTERKPQRRSYVVVTDCDGVEEAYYSSDGTWFDTLGDKLKDVTAWMPLPEPYERSEDD